jgi:ABC-type transport system substrate-binding protein
LASWDEQKIILIRNDTAKNISKLKKIDLIFSKDKLAAYNEFRKGNLDIIPLPPALAEQIVWYDPISRNFKIKQTGMHPDIQIFSGQNPQLIYCTLYSIRNPQVRRAFNFAVDRNQIKGARTDLIPASGPLFDLEFCGFQYDLQRARNLLKQAGFPNGTGLKDPYYLHTSPGAGPIAEKISENLKKIGINVTVVNTSWIGYQQISKKDMDIARFASLGPDPYGQLNVYQRPTFMVFNSRINKLTLKLSADRNNRALIKKLTNEIMQDPPLLYLFWSKNIYLAHPGLSGVDPDWFGLSPYLDIEK